MSQGKNAGFPKEIPVFAARSPTRVVLSGLRCGGGLDHGFLTEQGSDQGDAAHIVDEDEEHEGEQEGTAGEGDDLWKRGGIRRKVMISRREKRM